MDLSNAFESETSDQGFFEKNSQKKQKLTIQDFEIQGVLGEGSYGKVYCAIQKIDKKPYAIKVLDKYHIMKVHSVFIYLESKS
jgi:serine/threonine protein kinase